MPIFTETHDSVASIDKRLWIVLSLVLLAPLELMAKETAGAQTSQALEIRHAQTHIVVGAGQEYQRDLNLSVSYPLGKGDYPLIVFSHGHALDNLSYRNLTDYWVARGFVVVAPLHLDSGGDLKAVSVISKKVGNDWIAASRLLDLGAVIEQIDTIVSNLNGFEGQVLVDRVIAAGHSYGGLSSQQLAGAMLETHGDSIYSLPDSMIKPEVVAVVAISPPGLIKGVLSEKTWEGFTHPQLVVTGPNDFFPTIWPNYEDHFVSYLTADKGHNYLLVLDQMDHYLGGLIGRLDRETPPQRLALENLQEISMLFIQHYLRQPSSAKKNLEESQILQRSSEATKRDGVLRFDHR